MGDVLLLAINLADAARPHALAHIEQQRAGTAGEVEHAGETLSLAVDGFLAIEGDDGREDVGDLLRRIELPGFLARPGGKLADQVFVGVAEGIGVGREFNQTFNDF